MTEATVVIRLRLVGFGQHAGRSSQRAVRLPAQATVSDLLAWWRREEMGPPPEALLVIVNGRVVHQLQGDQTPLKAGDRIVLMRPAAGGAAEPA